MGSEDTEPDLLDHSQVNIHKLKIPLVKLETKLYIYNTNLNQKSTKLPSLYPSLSYTNLSSQNDEQSEEIAPEILDTLDKIRKPKLIKENGQMYTQRLSRQPATRQDAIRLCKELDTRLKARRAQVGGICPVRRQLYTEVFDEVIRQVCLTSQSKEGIILLIKVRDEMNMTLKSYEALLDSSVSKFAIEHIINSQNAMVDLKERIEAADIENKNLRTRIDQLETEYEEAQLAHNGLMATTQQQHDEKMEHKKLINKQSTLYLEELTAKIKKHEVIKP